MKKIFCAFACLEMALCLTVLGNESLWETPARNSDPAWSRLTGAQILNGDMFHADKPVSLDAQRSENCALLLGKEKPASQNPRFQPAALEHPDLWREIRFSQEDQLRRLIAKYDGTAAPFMVELRGNANESVGSRFVRGRIHLTEQKDQLFLDPERSVVARVPRFSTNVLDKTVSQTRLVHGGERVPVILVETTRLDPELIVSLEINWADLKNEIDAYWGIHNVKDKNKVVFRNETISIFRDSALTPYEISSPDFDFLRMPHYAKHTTDLIFDGLYRAYNSSIVVREDHWESSSYGAYAALEAYDSWRTYGYGIWRPLVRAHLVTGEVAEGIVSSFYDWRGSIRRSLVELSSPTPAGVKYFDLVDDSHRSRPLGYARQEIHRQRQLYEGILGIDANSYEIPLSAINRIWTPKRAEQVAQKRKKRL